MITKTEFNLSDDDLICEKEYENETIKSYWNNKSKTVIVLNHYFVLNGDDTDKEFEVLAEFNNLKDFEESEYYTK